MPKVKEREYRNIKPLEARAAAAAEEKLLQSDCYVEGYATTFDDPYVLFEDSEGHKYIEIIDRHALDNADMSDVIMQYDHCGKVYARQSNKTLVLKIDDKGLKIGADLSKTDAAKELYNEIDQGMITRMSWAFVIAPDGVIYEEKDGNYIKRITIITKVYDVSAVSIPADDNTEIEARSTIYRSYKEAKQELLKKRVRLLKIKTQINSIL